MNASSAGRLLLALSIATLLAAACAPVRPWQRGQVTKQLMNPAPSPIDGAFDSHVRGSREAMRGASKNSGPSCGCN